MTKHVHDVVVYLYFFASTMSWRGHKISWWSTRYSRHKHRHSTNSMHAYWISSTETENFIKTTCSHAILWSCLQNFRHSLVPFGGYSYTNCTHYRSQSTQIIHTSYTYTEKRPLIRSLKKDSSSPKFTVFDRVRDCQCSTRRGDYRTQWRWR